VPGQVKLKLVQATTRFDIELVDNPRGQR
jgi:hypothetical protein